MRKPWVPGAMKELVASKKSQNSTADLQEKQENLQKLSKQPKNTVEEFCDNLKHDMIIDIFCSENSNNKKLEVDKIEGKYKYLEKMNLNEMKRLLKNKPQQISPEEQNQRKKDARNLHFNKPNNDSLNIDTTSQPSKVSHNPELDGNLKLNSSKNTNSSEITKEFDPLYNKDHHDHHDSISQRRRSTSVGGEVTNNMNFKNISGPQNTYPSKQDSRPKHRNKDTSPPEKYPTPSYGYGITNTSVGSGEAEDPTAKNIFTTNHEDDNDDDSFSTVNSGASIFVAKDSDSISNTDFETDNQTRILLQRKNSQSRNIDNNDVLQDINLRLENQQDSPPEEKISLWNNKQSQDNFIHSVRSQGDNATDKAYSNSIDALNKLIHELNNDLTQSQKELNYYNEMTTKSTDEAKLIDTLIQIDDIQENIDDLTELIQDFERSRTALKKDLNFIKQL